ncbi:SDR family oxidoreductase [Marinomonas epiphytica]
MSPILLITGASRGIGAATAKLAAQQGYLVLVNYLKNEQAAQLLASEINEKGGKAYVIQGDVSDPNDVSLMFQTIEQRWGKLNALVNNAGILETQNTFVKTDPKRWQRIFQTNVFGTMLVSQKAITHMAKSLGGQGGSIVNVSSLAALTGSPNEYVDYAASKGAIDTFSMGLAKEVADEGIRVNVVRPGFIHTDMHSDGGEPDRVNRLAPSIPMGRGGAPEEVAESILWLLSDKSSYTTGSFINVAGGR